MIAPGLRFGRYEVGDRIGKGGFGVVHFARDVELGRDLAIKFLRREYQEKPKVVQRFLQEARAAARIGHPGIVTVFEAGEIVGTGLRADGTAFIAMELLKGESLADRIAEQGQLPVDLAISIGRQLASALGAAHHAGIIHRDLKPDNVHMIADPAVRGGVRIKILDFGVAKLVEADLGVHTHTQVVLGTPRYMSPEQSRSAARADHRSDIYSLGCILYELVCGNPPYGGDVGEVMSKHQTAPIPSPRAVVASTPPVLDRLISSMLAKSPEDRPVSMSDVDASLALCERFVFELGLMGDDGDERTHRDPLPPVPSQPPADVIPTSPYARLADTMIPARDATPTRRELLPLPSPPDTPFAGTRTVRDLRPLIPPRRPVAVPAPTPNAPLDGFPAGTAAHDQPTLVPGALQAFAPMTSEVTAVRPPKERARVWQFLVILAGLTLGAFVSLLVLSPDDEDPPVVVPMPPVVIDAPPLPPPAPVDAAVIDAAVEATTKIDDADQLKRECQQLHAREMWGDLLICAEKLHAFDPVLAQSYKESAIEEERSKPRIESCRQAIKDKDLKKAKAELDRVWPRSTSYQRLKAEYEKAKAEQEKAAAPPKCNADALVQRAEELWSSSQKEESLRAMEAAVACKPEPRHLLKALILACNRSNLSKARSFWKRLTAGARQQVLTICVRNGISEEELNAP